MRFLIMRGDVAAAFAKMQESCRRDQNSEQLKIIRPRQISLWQITLHFSCPAIAPQTGHLISLRSGDVAGLVISAEG